MKSKILGFVEITTSTPRSLWPPQKNEEISDLKKQILDIDNFLTCLIMIAYMNEAEARQSTENQNIMEHRSLMEDLVAMKMEYDNEKNSLE